MLPFFRFLLRVFFAVLLFSLAVAKIYVALPTLCRLCKIMVLTYVKMVCAPALVSSQEALDLSRLV